MRQDSFIEGELRKRWHPHIPVEQADSDSHLMVQGAGSSSQTLADNMQSEIEKLKIKTDNHLKVPQIKTKSPYRKTTMFLIFLGLVFLGLVFFCAGFMTCFSLFPPQHVSAAPTDATPAIQGQSGYAARNSYIAGASGAPQREGILTQIEKQTELASKRRAQESVAQTTDAINSKITNALGYRVESILEPITKGIAGLLINNIADPRTTGMSYNARGIRYNSNQTTPVQSGAPIQSVPQAQVMPEAPSVMPVPGGMANGSGAPAVVTGSVAGGDSSAPGGTPQAENNAGANNQNMSQNLTAEGAIHKAQEKTINIKQASGGHAGLYAVEMSTFEQSQDAYVQMTDMRKRGYDAYIVRVVVGSNLVYSLRFGDFKSYQDARDAVQGFRSLWGQPARVVITSPQDDRMSFK